MPYPPEMTVRIDPMEVGDLEEIHRIETVSFRFPWNLAIFRHYLLNTPSFEGLIARESTDGSKGPLLAYIACIALREENHIISIAVDPEHRRKGVASRLMEHLVSRGIERGVKRITLEVRVSNGPAIEFYRSCGLSPVALISGYYRDTGEDALIMWRDGLDTG